VLQQNTHVGNDKKRSQRAFLLTHYRPAMPFGNRKFILEDLFSSVLSLFQKYHPSGHLKFNYLGIFKRLKLRILMGKILLIPLELNFTPYTLGCYGLRRTTASSSLPVNRGVQALSV